MSIITGSVKPSKTFEAAKLTIPKCEIRKCDSKCHLGEWQCERVKILPFGIQSDSSENIGDLFFHRTSEKCIQGCLIIYNAVADCSIVDYNFQDMWTCYKKETSRKACLRFIPKSENNKNVTLEEQFKIIDFELEANYHYHTDLILRGEILLEVKFDIDTKLNHNIAELPNNLNNLVSSISAQAIDQFNEDRNFKIISNGEDFYFNKTLLSLVSEVFQKMLQGNSKEAQDNCVEISDFSQDTIRTFEKFSFSSEKIKPEEITIELLMFANKYFMKPLETECKNYLLSTLNKDNLQVFIKAAYDIDDEKMLKVGAKYLSRIKSDLKDSEEWKKFEDLNPKCMMKVYRSIVYN